MKATEIIKQLQELIDQHGDAEVIDYDGYTPTIFEFDKITGEFLFDIV